MATRRRARANSLTNAMSDVRQRLQYLEARPSRSRIAAYAVRRTNVQPRAISTDQLDFQSATTEIIADDAVTNDKLAVDSVDTPQIVDGAVTNPGIDDGAVNSRTLADNAVESRHIKDGEVKESDIGTDAVTRGKIKDGEVIESKLATDAVTRGKIKDGEVTESELATDAVTRGKIKDGEVIESKLATDSVTRNKIKNDEVIFEKLAADSVRRKQIQNGEVTHPKLAVDAVETPNIRRGAVTTDKIDTRAVTTIKIADENVTRGKLNFTPVETVSAGNGLSGGGSARSVTLSVNFNSVATAGHTHNQYAGTNHTHSGNTTGQSGGDVDYHTHTISGLGSVSSRTLKKDIEDYEIDPEKVLRLSLKRFRYLNHARKFQKNLGNRDWNYGYIAEEVLDSGLEELLIYDDQGKPFGLNYGLVGVLSLELVRSLKEKVELLEQRVLELEKGL